MEYETVPFSLSEATFGNPKPSAARCLQRLRFAEASRVASAHVRNQQLSEEEAYTRELRRKALLQGNAMSVEALTASRAGMVNITKQELCYIPEGMPLVSVSCSSHQRTSSTIISLYCEILSKLSLCKFNVLYFCCCNCC